MHVTAIASTVAIMSLCGQVRAASVILDTFNEGEHQLAVGVDSSEAEVVNSPFGFTRRITAINRTVPPRSTVTSTLSQPSAAVEFHAVGTGLAINSPLEMRIHYLDGGPYSLVGESAFQFDVEVIAGMGNLIIELGSETAIYGPEIKRIPINMSGAITVPFSEINFGTGGSINSFYSMHFTIEAATEEYAMTLNEIRIIPEPANLALVAASALGLLSMRRRHSFAAEAM